MEELLQWPTACCLPSAYLLPTCSLRRLHATSAAATSALTAQPARGPLSARSDRSTLVLYEQKTCALGDERALSAGLRPELPGYSTALAWTPFAGAATFTLSFRRRRRQAGEEPHADSDPPPAETLPQGAHPRLRHPFRRPSLQHGSMNANTVCPLWYLTTVHTLSSCAVV